MGQRVRMRDSIERLTVPVSSAGLFDILCRLDYYK